MWISRSLIVHILDQGFQLLQISHKLPIHNGTNLKDHVLVLAIFQRPKIDFLNFQPKIWHMNDHKSEHFFMCHGFINHFKGVKLGHS